MTTTRGLSILAALLASLAFAAPTSAGPDQAGYPKAFSCSACHGQDGHSRSEAVPILAGMPAWYFKKAIEDYASGRRPSAEMEPFAKMVRGLGVDDVAAYFAAQRRQATPLRPDPAAVERGRAAAGQCVVCHGPAGKGDPAKGIPDITGQPPAYLRNQMLLFKEDRRSPGDAALKALKALFKQVPSEQIPDLAAYYSSLR
jgi:cytochrome c553